MEFLSMTYTSQRMTTGDYRRYYYAANRSYYQQGAITHNAVISLLGAERYSILGQDAFASDRGVLIAYDPLVLMGILESLGISQRTVAGISTDDLITIRQATSFAAFRDSYFEFALALQELSVHVNRLSRNVLLELSHRIQSGAVSRVFSEEMMFLDRQRLWNVGEMTFFAVALGVVGFFVVPLIGALLGTIPIVLYRFGLTPKLSDFVISRLAEKQLPFCVFVRELREVTDRIKTQQHDGDASSASIFY